MKVHMILEPDTDKPVTDWKPLLRGSPIMCPIGEDKMWLTPAVKKLSELADELLKKTE